MANKISRRTILLRGIQIPVGGAVLLGLGACSGGGGEGEALVCADPSKMDAGQRNMRQSLNYMETSPDPAKVCGGCAFFHAGQEAGTCGTCDIFSGQPANPHGHCDSWSAKA